MPSVFVLMPFDEKFDPVYEAFIRPLFEGEGFEVNRADDIQSQGNILRDIIEAIVKSDLIVADLTDSNPNVYYEVGIAHAIGKPVILVTQAIETLPFDLKPYRVVEYSVFFYRIEEARDQLARYAKQWLEGRLVAGNPVTDFLPVGSAVDLGTKPPPEDSEDEEERGIIDHLIDVNEGYNRLDIILGGVTSKTQTVNRSIHDAVSDLSDITANRNQTSAKAIQTVCRRLAERIEDFNQNLESANEEYKTVAQGTEDSLEILLSFQMQQSTVTDPKVVEWVECLRQLKDVCEYARESQNQFAAAMDGVPPLESHLTRQLKRGSAAIRGMVNNIDKTIASIERALSRCS